MGFKNPMDVNSVTHQIYMSGVELRSPYNDGFNQWAIKQELYKLKWLLDDILESSPQFADEADFLKEREQQKILQVLTK